MPERETFPREMRNVRQAPKNAEGKQPLLKVIIKAQNNIQFINHGLVIEEGQTCSPLDIADPGRYAPVAGTARGHL